MQRVGLNDLKILTVCRPTRELVKFQPAQLFP